MLGLTTCEMAEISGVELGVAPLRPPNFHTVERQVKFVPYGLQASPSIPLFSPFLPHCRCFGQAITYILFSPLFLPFRMRCRLQNPEGNSCMCALITKPNCQLNGVQRSVHLPVLCPICKICRVEQETRAVAALCTHTHSRKCAQSNDNLQWLAYMHRGSHLHSSTEHRGDQRCGSVFSPSTLDMANRFCYTYPVVFVTKTSSLCWQVSEDTERLAYYRKLEGFLAATVRPHLVAMQASEDGLPDHLQKARPSLSLFEFDID